MHAHAHSPISSCESKGRGRHHGAAVHEHCSDVRTHTHQPTMATTAIETPSWLARICHVPRASSPRDRHAAERVTQKKHFPAPVARRLSQLLHDNSPRPPDTANVVSVHHPWTMEKVFHGANRCAALTLPSCLFSPFRQTPIHCVHAISTSLSSAPSTGVLTPSIMPF
jgi:hypothetical protein